MHAFRALTRTLFTRRVALFAAAAAAFLGTILIANYVTSRYGMVPVGFGLYATAGTYLAGLAFVLRDSLQDIAGRTAVVVLICIGASLSYGISAPGIATASAVAFLASEAADFAIYSPLRDRGYIRAAVASNVVGSLVDTALFLWLAAPALRAVIPGFRAQDAFFGQVVGKLAITGVVILVVTAVRVSIPARSTTAEE
jgi:hypothetical protein